MENSDQVPSLLILLEVDLNDLILNRTPCIFFLFFKRRQENSGQVLSLPVLPEIDINFLILNRIPCTVFNFSRAGTIPIWKYVTTNQNETFQRFEILQKKKKNWHARIYGNLYTSFKKVDAFLILAWCKIRGFFISCC